MNTLKFNYDVLGVDTVDVFRAAILDEYKDFFSDGLGSLL